MFEWIPSAAALALASCSALAVAAEPAPRPRAPANVSAAASAPPAGAQSASTRAALVFAKVGETEISGADYQRALSVEMRRKYYHAKPPEEEVARFQREVGDNLVNRVLLLAEARRRGVQPDHERIKTTVAGYDTQYQASPNWKENRARMLAGVVPQLELESTLERFERIVKTVPEPDEATARAYYEQHKDLFVEPEQVKLSVIVLRVDPSSPQALWNSARTEIQGIHKRLRAGANFAELARLHSGDRSASRGGEMDYTHRGMLPEAVHGVVDKLGPGELSEPVQLLEGWTVMRLDDRRKSQQRSFEQVRQRAGELWQRAEGEERWKKLIATLRQATSIRIDESHYAPLRGPSEKPRAG